MQFIKFSAFLSAFLLATQVWAAPAGDDADASAKVTSDKKGDVTKYDFEDDNVDGELLSPEGANIASRGKVKHASLINIRPHFIPEMIKMANDV